MEIGIQIAVMCGIGTSTALLPDQQQGFNQIQVL